MLTIEMPSDLWAVALKTNSLDLHLRPHVIGYVVRRRPRPRVQRIAGLEDYESPADLKWQKGQLLPTKNRFDGHQIWDTFQSFRWKVRGTVTGSGWDWRIGDLEGTAPTANDPFTTTWGEITIVSPVAVLI